MELANGGLITPSQTRSGHAHLLTDLLDVDDAGAINGDVLVHTGDAWVPGPPVPVGTIIASTTEVSAIPPGYLHAIGGRVDRVRFAELFDVIGTRYGAGDGVTTFNLPACSGTFGGATVTWWIKY